MKNVNRPLIAPSDKPVHRSFSDRLSKPSSFSKSEKPCKPELAFCLTGTLTNPTANSSFNNNNNNNNHNGNENSNNINNNNYDAFQKWKNRNNSFEPLQSPSRVMQMVREFQKRNEKLNPPPFGGRQIICNHTINVKPTRVPEKPRRTIFMDASTESPKKENMQTPPTVTDDPEALEVIEQLDKSIEEVTVRDEKFVCSEQEFFNVECPPPSPKGIQIDVNKRFPSVSTADVSVNTDFGDDPDNKELILTEDEEIARHISPTQNKIDCINYSEMNEGLPHRHRLSCISIEGAVVAQCATDVNKDEVKLPKRPTLSHFVVVAIDFGTTYSGYAFSFTRSPNEFHMMRQWQGGDPGVINQKAPTVVLLRSDGSFHSFGFEARNYYHNLSVQEAQSWLYFDKFKMILHHEKDISQETFITATNGKRVAAMSVFAYVLGFFKDLALRELSDQSAITFLNEDVRWVVTVPAIWRQSAKQFMRLAAYKAGLASEKNPDQLIIALEPEAASIYCRKLRVHQLINSDYTKEEKLNHEVNNSFSENQNSLIAEMSKGTRYMVVDCGGGTVDITVHEMADSKGSLKELHKATGGAHGSVGVDFEFEKLMDALCGKMFMQKFKEERPAGYVDLMIAFESSKRYASPNMSSYLNIALPFSLNDLYKKCHHGSHIKSAIKKFGRREIHWSDGMLRIEPVIMKELFHPTLQKITQHIQKVIDRVENIKYLFLVGGFAESPLLQHKIRNKFSALTKVVIPQAMSLAILHGAVMFGLDPTIVNVRRSRMTYGVGILNRFSEDKHPNEKKINKDGKEYCVDIFDKFIGVDESVGLGDVVLRTYTPAKIGQKQIVMHIYCTENDSTKFITDLGVHKCATLFLDLQDLPKNIVIPELREIQAHMTFGDTEIKIQALDVITNKSITTNIDFLKN